MSDLARFISTRGYLRQQISKHYGIIFEQGTTQFSNTKIKQLQTKLKTIEGQIKDINKQILTLKWHPSNPDNENMHHNELEACDAYEEKLMFSPIRNPSGKF